MAPRPVDPSQSFPELEQQVLERWRERDVFQESMRRREGAEPWVFFEGPPTANGKPGVHHVLSRVFKDIFPRYKTMRGHHVQRRGGWDCHGLPVEIQVEKALGLTSKSDIEAYGIAEFNAKCRESVFEFLEDWDRLTERIGFWVDLDEAYRTLDATYVESVWWSLKEIASKDLLYEGHRVVPYCPRCGTALSSHEVAQGYKDVVDESVYVRFVATGAHGAVSEGDVLLGWTTTPWTLPSNAALAVDPDLDYVRAQRPGDDDVYVLAAALRERVLGEESAVVGTFAGRELEGVRYAPPFDFIPSSEWGEKAHSVLLGDFVTADDGTGIVHTAIAFGEDDYRLGTEAGLTVVNPVRLDGTYDERITGYEGRFVKDADQDLVQDLQARGKLLRAEDYEHSYPHCWRCSTPLLYYAKPSWYIRTSQIRGELLAANETINWYPPHIKEGRFGRWLENNVDWALSRERYWGTPLPVWRSEDDPDEWMVVGSFEELASLSGVTLDDPHRPFVDDVTFPHPQTGATMRRVPEVIDVWFDSGAMPFAQLHAPFENAEQFESHFPGQFICEALDQTRGWFYSMLAVSTLLRGRSSYENVVCLGLILDENGEKMSKSKGNIVPPWEVLDEFGADALRWYFFTSKQPWDGYRFSKATIGEGVRVFLRQLWNTYGFLTIYEPAEGTAVAAAQRPELDRWILSRLAATVAEVTERLDDYDATFGGRAIQAFVDDLSNWYVRRSRRRFWDGEPDAFATLRECMLTTAKLLAPFTPFVADEIYDNLDGDLASVHLCDWPSVASQDRPRDVALEEAMATARETVRMGLAARGQAKVKVRQPLREAVIVADGREREAIEAHAEIVREELNVKALRFVEQADELGSYELKANYRSLGPRFGKDMPQAAAAIAALDPAHVAVALREGTRIGISVAGHDHDLGEDDLTLAMQPLEGYQLEREGSHAVALDLNIDDELLREGQAREIVRAVQNARKDAGLEVEDRIALVLDGDGGLLGVALEFEAVVAGEVLATSYDAAGGEGLGASGFSTETSIDGATLRIGVTKA